jgi:hypothetical protein
MGYPAPSDVEGAAANYGGGNVLANYASYAFSAQTEQLAQSTSSLQNLITAAQNDTLNVAATLGFVPNGAQLVLAFIGANGGGPPSAVALQNWASTVGSYQGGQWTGYVPPAGYLYPPGGAATNAPGNPVAANPPSYFNASDIAASQNAGGVSTTPAASATSSGVVGTFQSDLQGIEGWTQSHEQWLIGGVVALAAWKLGVFRALGNIIGGRRRY